MKKLRILTGTVLFMLIAGIFGGLSPVMADGIIVPPYYYPVYETAQKGFIIYDDGVETLVLTAVFQGSAKDFGWIIPLPNEPEVDRARVDIFEDLEEMTTPKKSLLDKIMYPEEDYYYPMGGYGDVMEMSGQAEAPRSTVVVHEEKRVGIFSVAVLTAEKVEDLEDWLDENEYELPRSGSNDDLLYMDDDYYGDDEYPVDYPEVIDNDEIMIMSEPPPSRNPVGIDRSRAILQDYIDAEWFFVAVKVDNRFIDDTNADVGDGHGEISPLKFTFKTSDIVYPMRITSLSSRGIDTTIYTLTDEKVWVSNYDSRWECTEGDYYQNDYNFEKVENYCSDFDMTYGSVVSSAEVEDLTKEVGKGSWYKPDKKMYLSKHVSNYLLPEAMTADVLFEDVGGTSGLNDGSMSLWEWIKLPFAFVIYTPRNILMGITEGFGYVDSGMGIFVVVAAMVGGAFLSAVVAFAWYLALKRTTRRGFRIVWYLMQFPAVWLFSMLMGISVAVLFALLGSAVGVHEDAAVINAMLMSDMLALVIALVFYRFQWKAKVSRKVKPKKARK